MDKLKDLIVNLSINTDKTREYLQLTQGVREDLQSQFTLGIRSTSSFEHLSPSTKASVGSNEFSELVSLFLHCFDTTCIRHCLKSLEVSVLPNEVIG